MKIDNLEKVLGLCGLVLAISSQGYAAEYSYTVVTDPQTPGADLGFADPGSVDSQTLDYSAVNTDTNKTNLQFEMSSDSGDKTISKVDSGTSNNSVVSLDKEENAQKVAPAAAGVLAPRGYLSRFSAEETAKEVTVVKADDLDSSSGLDLSGESKDSLDKSSELGSEPSKTEVMSESKTEVKTDSEVASIDVTKDTAVIPDAKDPDSATPTKSDPESTPIPTDSKTGSETLTVDLSTSDKSGSGDLLSAGDSLPEKGIELTSK